jgi:hypothetical protein
LERKGGADFLRIQLERKKRARLNKSQIAFKWLESVKGEQQKH